MAAASRAARAPNNCRASHQTPPHQSVPSRAFSKRAARTACWPDEPEHRRQQQRIARRAKDLPAVGAVLIRAAFGERPAQGEVAVAIAHAEVFRVRVARLPIEGTGHAHRQRQGQYQQQRVASRHPAHAHVTTSLGPVER